MARPLGEGVLVSGQIRAEDVAGFAARGVTRIVNNRPDGEEAGQPPGAEIEAAARAAGIDYAFIPIAGGFSGAQVAAMDAALANAAGDVLALLQIRDALDLSLGAGPRRAGRRSGRADRAGRAGRLRPGPDPALALGSGRRC